MPRAPSPRPARWPGSAPYVEAGLSKLTTSGLVWADATVLRSAILSTHPVDDSSLLALYARLVVDSGGVARALSVATLVIQLGAVAYVVGPRLRMLWGALLLSFHVNVALLSQSIFYVQSCVLLLAFSFPWGRIFPQRATDAAGSDSRAGCDTRGYPSCGEVGHRGRGCGVADALPRRPRTVRPGGPIRTRAAPSRP